MKLIFLDIDGVVATERSYTKANIAWYGASNEREVARLRKYRIGSSAYRPDFNLELWPFDEVAVSILHKIVRENDDVKFVISSTWREKETIESLEHMFNLKGLYIPIVGFTPIMNDERGLEITTFLDEFRKNNTVTHWCVIDDRGISIRKYVDEKLIQTNPNIGIDEPEYGMICKLLDIRV